MRPSISARFAFAACVSALVLASCGSGGWSPIGPSSGVALDSQTRLGQNAAGPDALSEFAYVANYDDNDVSAYKINETSGALASVKGSPFGAGSGAYTVTVDPTGKFAYVINLGSGDIFAYTINATSGALKPVAGSPFKAGSFPDCVATCRRVGSTCKPPPL